MEIQAPAKINLTLEVINKRDDGFHNISSVMQTIGLYDTLVFRESPRIQLEIDSDSLPLGDGMRKMSGNSKIEDNLAYKAAVLFKEKTGYKGGASIQLKKNIPSASGLGGGSSDAAATLKGLNKLWKTGLSDKELANIGSNLGSDIPFFVYGGTCLVEGRGERITRLKPAAQCYFVLFIPFLEIPQKTRTLYSHVTPRQYTNGDTTRAMVEAITNNQSIIKHCWNVFTGLYPDIFPGSEILFKQFKQAGLESVHICGSGPALYCITTGSEEAQRIPEKLKFIAEASNALVILLNKSIPVNDQSQGCI
jgi:4-diphosphocytidyl-2-C-methyl-D-erythritol kinase